MTAGFYREIAELNARLGELRQESARMRDSLIHIATSNRCSTVWETPEAALKATCPVCVAKATLALASTAPSPAVATERSEDT